MVILNSRFSTVTIDDGTFFFKDVYAGSYILNVSRIGYATINRRITVAAEMNHLKITLSTAHTQLSEVIVTAQKREELVQRLPIIITTLSSQDIENYDLRNSNDLTAIVPDSYTADTGDKRSVTSIRGITTTSYDPAVAVYIDGVNQFGLDTYMAQLFDVERIEVLRGPHGTLYGRNAMGGVINFITKRPRNATSGFAEATFEGYGQKRFTAGVRAPLIKDKLFFGAAGLYEALNGFYKNDFFNSNYDKQHNVSGNYSLNYLPDRAWALSFNLKHAANRNNGSFPRVFGKEKL